MRQLKARSFSTGSLLPHFKFIEIAMNTLPGRYPECSRKSRRLDTNKTGDLFFRETPVNAPIDVVKRCLQEILRESSILFGCACFFCIVFDQVCGEGVDQ